MLFNSYEFLFLFLPISVVGFYVLAKISHHLSAFWLFALSLLFYAWWNAAYVILLLTSIGFNFAMGLALGRRSGRRSGGERSKKLLLAFAVAANLGILFYYKYAIFLLENLNLLFQVAYDPDTIFLPLGISFFTFTQLTFLVDTYRGETREYDLTHYGLFVTYFPHLIAGPILHHREMIPQFARRETYSLNWTAVAAGATLFSIGLFKKVVLADGVSEFANTVFDGAKVIPVTFLEAWSGALAYTLQIYFDFSGYSDMAVGASLLFGVTLPLNFASPYKALSVIDFWRRWHITLSRLLRDYLYIPLGGNRLGIPRRHANLLVTMLIGGLWHGASWTFVVWGGLHGVYLIVNHAWRYMRSATLSAEQRFPRLIANFASWLVTMIAVVFAWVFFRSPSMDVALNMLSGMVGLNGIALGVNHQASLAFASGFLEHIGIRFNELTLFSLFSIPWILVLFMIATMFPNSQELVLEKKPFGALAKLVCWQPSIQWGIASGLLLAISIAMISGNSDFLYFNF